jgi:hypothetical protein
VKTSSTAKSNKRAELAGRLRQLEQQLAQQRTSLAHLDATMRLFDLDIRPNDIRPRQQWDHAHQGHPGGR